MNRVKKLPVSCTIGVGHDVCLPPSPWCLERGCHHHMYRDMWDIYMCGSATPGTPMGPHGSRWRTSATPDASRQPSSTAPSPWGDVLLTASDAVEEG
jgi:hypothetical protein